MAKKFRNGVWRDTLTGEILPQDWKPAGGSLADAIVAGEKPANFLTAKQVDCYGHGVRSPIDDKVYTSRSAYESHVKASGGEIVGNDFASKTKARREKVAEHKEREKAKEKVC